MADRYFGSNAGKVTIKGGKTSRSQRDILGRALAYAEKVNAPYNAKVALITAIIQESEAKNLTTPSADGYGSYGVLQGLERYYGKKKLLNPEFQFGVFLGKAKNGDGRYTGFTGKGNAISLARKGMNPGAIAQTVNGSAYPERYYTSLGEAKKIIRLFQGGKVPGAPVDSVTGGTASPGTSSGASADTIASVLNYAKLRRQGRASVADLASSLAASSSSTPAVSTTQGVSKSSSRSSKPSVSGDVGSPGNPNGSKIKELFYDPMGGWKGTTNIGPIGGHSDHVHVAAGRKTVIRLGKVAQKMGLHVGENSYFSGATPTGGHAPNSWHYKDRAIDVSGDQKKMAAFARYVRRLYGLK